MARYIIEIEDEPFIRKSALYGEQVLYRVKGFESLVLSKDDLEKLQQWLSPNSAFLPYREEVIVSVRDYSGDTPYDYTTTAWKLGDDWISNNELLYGVVKGWMPFPKPISDRNDR